MEKKYTVTVPVDAADLEAAENQDWKISLDFLFKS